MNPPAGNIDEIQRTRARIPHRAFTKVGTGVGDLGRYVMTFLDEAPAFSHFAQARSLYPRQVTRVAHAAVLAEARGGELAIAGTQDVPGIPAKRAGQVQNARCHPLRLELFRRLGHAPHPGFGHRRDRIDQDAVFQPFHAQGVHDAHLGHLARRVGDQAWLGIALIHGAVRGGEDYAWCLGLLEVLPGMLGEPHRGVHADAQCAIEKRLFLCLDALVIDPTGVVDENIQRAEMRDGQLHQFAAFFFVFQVADMSDHIETLAPQGFECDADRRRVLTFARAISAQVADDYPRSPRGQRHGVIQAQALGGTGDDGDFIFEWVCAWHCRALPILLFYDNNKKINDLILKACNFDICWISPETRHLPMHPDP